MNTLALWHGLQSLLLQIWIKTHLITLYNRGYFNDCVHSLPPKCIFLYLVAGFTFIRAPLWLLVQGFTSHSPMFFCCTAPLLKVVILGLKQKLVWSYLKGLKKERLSCYVWKSLDPLWSWAVMTQTWSEPFYIPSFSSTCQSFTELIF